MIPFASIIISHGPNGTVEASYLSQRTRKLFRVCGPTVVACLTKLGQEVESFERREPKPSGDWPSAPGKFSGGYMKADPEEWAKQHSNVESTPPMVPSILAR